VVPMVSNNLNMMIAGTVMQSLLSGLFSGPSPQQQQQKLLQQQQQQQLLLQQQMQQKKIKDSIDNAMYLKLMGSYKPLQGSQKVDFKKLDGDMESMAAAAREPFDGKVVISGEGNSNATNFFGTNMPATDIETLVYPEKNLVVVDVEKTNQYLKEKRKEDSIKKADLEKQQAVKKSVECETLQKRYDSYITQRNKFHKTIELTDRELTEWKKRNNDALWNAAQSGFELFLNTKILGDNGLLSTVEKKGIEAENIKQRLLLHADELRLKGIDVDGYLRTLNARIFNKNFLAKDIGEFKDAVEYQTYFRDALQASIATVGETDTAYSNVLKDPSVQLLLNDGEHPGVDAGHFIAGKVLEKLISSQFLGNLIKFNNKIPYVTYAQFAVDQTYNALDWILSYKNIVQQREVQGQELQSAMSLQMQIDKTYDQLKTCPGK